MRVSLVALASLLLSTSALHAGTRANAPAGENLYCLPGDVPNFGDHDGPAALPRSCYYTDSSATPSPGHTILVLSGGNVTNVLANTAACGDIVQLAAGGVFGPFTVPAKNCDANHYITIRTSAPDLSLPPEGTQITPCYSGVASLQGRPAYSCPVLAAATAQILFSNSSITTYAISFSPGASYYRFIGLEITRPAGGSYKTLVSLNGASHVIFDRVWIHGTALDTTYYGMSLDASNYAAVIDSYFTDFHCLTSSTTCKDSSAITGGSATAPEGAWKLANNFLEASMESFATGESGATVTPADLEIRHNYFFKPTFWMPGDPAYNGLGFYVRNVVEMKNSVRILFEGNVSQNSWGYHQDQQGAAYFLTPRNHITGGLPDCPICIVTDVVIRFNRASRVPQAFSLTIPPNTQRGYAYAANTFSIHDDLFDDLNYQGCDQCSVTYTNQIFSGTNQNLPPPSAVLHDITLSHVTQVASGTPTGFLQLGGMTAAYPPQQSNIDINNSIFIAGIHGFTNSGQPASNCANVSSGAPLAMFNACWVPYSFLNNVVVGGGSLPFKNLQWPASTFLPAKTDVIGFVNFNGGAGGDYHLSLSSPYKNAGTDGLDIGANIDLVNSFTQGVTTGTWN